MRHLPVFAAFGHVLRSTLNNLKFAWHLSWPWMVVILPVNVLASIYGASLDPAAEEPSGQAVALTLIVGLLTMFGFSSIAVSWHRYVLLDEVPRGMSRLRADNTVWRYFGNTLLIILIIMAGFIPALIFISLLTWGGGNVGAVLALPIYAAMLVFGIGAFYRLSVKLPAIAMERRDFHMKDAWAVTQGNMWQLFGLAGLFFVAVIGMALVLGGVAWLLNLTGLSAAVLFGLALQIMFNWIVTIMGVTLLTSLYGYFVEKRDF
jgi:hypothetical protein